MVTALTGVAAKQMAEELKQKVTINEKTSVLTPDERTALLEFIKSTDVIPLGVSSTGRDFFVMTSIGRARVSGDNSLAVTATCALIAHNRLLYVDVSQPLNSGGDIRIAREACLSWAKNILDHNADPPIRTVPTRKDNAVEERSTWTPQSTVSGGEFRWSDIPWIVRILILGGVITVFGVIRDKFKNVRADASTTANAAGPTTEARSPASHTSLGGWEDMTAMLALAAKCDGRFMKPKFNTWTRFFARSCCLLRTTG